jgi:APA family basic amino acid/polyamine antiporter
MPSLERRLGPFPATNLVIGDMIGAGIFTTSGLLMAELGSPVMMLALWLAGGFLALCGALCFGELGAAMPRAGGEYVYLGELFHPLLGFLTGWVSFFAGFSAPLAAISMGCGEYLTGAFSGPVGSGDPAIRVKALAILIIGSLAAVHLRGIELGARVQNALTVGKVMLILGLVAAGFTAGEGSVGHFAGGSPAVGDGWGWKVAGLSLMWIMFAYSGWNAAGYVGSEIRDPARNLPVSLLAGTGIVILLYLGLNVLFVYALPPGKMDGVIAVGGLAASRLWGRGGEVAVSALIAFALLSSVSALIILGPRVYYAMARDGYFFRSFGEVHPQSRVPSRAILLQCGMAAVLVVTGTFEQILTYMGFCLGIFPIVTVLGVFRLRRMGSVGWNSKSGGGQIGAPEGPGTGPAEASYRMPLYPLPPLVFALASCLILVLAYLERPVESSIALGTVGLGIPVFFLFRRRRRQATGVSRAPATES